nr:hypothetical protein [Mycobacterium lepromatosis]
MTTETGRLLEALPQSRFNEACQWLALFLDPDTLNYLRDSRFISDINGYAKGEL